MGVDWSEVWRDAVGAATESVKAKGPAAKMFVREAASARAKRMKLLVIAFATGDIDQATFDDELAEERDLLKAEFLAIQVLTKKAAQDAVNALFGVIEKALLQGINVLV